MKKIADSNGIEVYYIRTDNKFKTSVISISFCDNLSGDRAFLNSLLPAVLWHGCKSCPSAKALSAKLQELCIVDMDSNVDRRGEIQLIQFSAELLSPSYAAALADRIGTEETGNVPVSPASFSEVFSLLLELLLNPVLENGVFPEEIVRRECENLEEMIRTSKNDKQAYAVQRMAELMCEGEPYSLFELGNEGDGALVTGERLYRYYREYFLRKMPVKIFYCGDEEPEDLPALLKKSGLHADACDCVTLCGGYLPEKCVPQEIRRFTETAEVSDGKLVLGYRIDMDFSLAGRAVLVLLNAILGGGSSSKMFRIVREQEGLAYYCASRVIAMKGLLICFAGIAAEDMEKTERLMEKQLEEIRAGRMTDEELETAKTMLISELHSYRDTQFTLIDYYISRSLLPEDGASLEDLERAIAAVTAEEIAACAARIRPDTVYFMYGEEHEDDTEDAEDGEEELWETI